MLTSVVIPVYNGEDFIARAIDSVLSQTYPVHELIVVNDGSQDRTADILAAYSNSIHTITIPNGGVSHARNIGIAASSGNIVAFLDADDIWNVNKLFEQIAVFQKFPDVGFCCCDYSVLNKQLNREVNHLSTFVNWEGLYFDRPLHKSFAVLLIENFVGTCSTVAIRKPLLDKVGGFDESLRQAEDYDLWLRFAMQTEFVVLSDVLVEKSTHDSNLTNDVIEMCSCHERVLMGTYLKYKDHIIADHLFPSYGIALAAKRYQIGNGLFEEARYGQAFRYYTKALSSIWSFSNIMAFIGCTSRKVVRLLSGGLIAKKRFRT